MGMWYAEDEFTFKGEEVFYEYEGGSGGWMKQGFSEAAQGLGRISRSAK